MKASFRLGRIAGIDIGVHYTWLFAFALITWSLANGFFPAQYPSWDARTYWITGAVASLLLFVSVLLHELAHSFVARGFGYPVESITLFIFGGVSRIKGEADKPRHEFLIAAVGPGASLGLALAFWLVMRVAGFDDSPVGAVVGYLALINLLLGLFNLIPGFPLDGGRVLRSIVWRTTGSVDRATRVAASVGQAFGWALIAFGVYQAVFAGNPLGGLWMVLIGWFLSSAAESSRRESVTRSVFQGVTVREVMDHAAPAVEPVVTVESVVMNELLQGGHRCVLVAEGGHLLGIASISDVRTLERDRWSGTRIADIMTPMPLKTVEYDADINEAAQLLAEHDLNQLPVMDGENCVGMLKRSDLIRRLQLSQALGVKPGR